MLAWNIPSASQYGASKASIVPPATAAAHQPAGFSGHPALRIHTGISNAGNALAIAAKAMGTLASTFQFFASASPHTIPKIASASLWPLPANSTITSGFHAYTATRKLRSGSLRNIHASSNSASTSAVAKGTLNAVGPGNSFHVARNTHCEPGG